MHQRADLDGDGFVDFNELVDYVQPAHQNRAAPVPVVEMQMQMQRKQLTATSDLMGRVAVHLAGREEEKDGGGEEGEEVEIALTLRTMAKRAMAKRRQEANERATASFQAEQERQMNVKDQADVRALSESDYASRLRKHVRQTVAAGYEDHTASLSPRALRRLCRQIQRFDSSSVGGLDFDAFCALCARVAEAQGEMTLSSLQLFALFNQADVTGAKAICASQWCWARGQLATMLGQQRQAQEMRLVRAEAMRQEDAKEVSASAADHPAEAAKPLTLKDCTSGSSSSAPSTNLALTFQS